MSNAGRFERILPGVLGVVVGPGGTIALVHQKHGPFAGNWLLPGGGIDYGESAEQAVIREVFEETGICVADPVFFATYEMRGDWTEGRYHLLMLAFLATANQKIPDGFVGHNVNGVQQVRIDGFPLHSTDLRILTDAGVAHFPEDRIRQGLERDGIEMSSYRNR